MRHENMRKDAIARLIRTRNGLAMPLPARLSDAEVDIARKLSFSAAQDDEDGDQGQDQDDEATRKVQTVIRIRPLASNSSTGDECFRVVSDTALVAQPPKTSQAYRSTGAATSFQFSRIFQPQTAQQAFFEATTKPVIDAAFDGKNGLVFAYGVTNSGKTHTITGSESQPGVLPRALKHVMAELQRRKDSDSTPVAKVTASYLEIYNENVYDLLATTVRKRRALRVQDCDGKIQVRGVIEKQIKSLQEGEEMLTTGRSNTQVAETNCNMDSSRSHCVFTLHFYTQNKSTGATSLRSKVSIVDLAGSERGAKSGATGIRMQEASKINGSLMNLMRCIETLRWNQQHPASLHKMVPFRESKLTRLFQENLVGKQPSSLVMIVAVNPSSHEFDETLRTLKYSAMARELISARATRSATRKQAATSTFYDLDGRLKKKRARVSIEPQEEPEEDAKPTEEVKSKPSDVPRERRQSTTVMDSASKYDKLTSERKKRDRGSKPPLGSTKTKNRADRVSGSVTKLAKLQHENEELRMQLCVVTGQLEQKEHELQLAQLNAEQMELEAHLLVETVNELKQELDTARQQLEQLQTERLQLEVQIRAEIGSEMRDQLQQYHNMVQRQQRSKDLLLSSAKKRKGEALDDSSKVKQLQAQLKEAEDEIKRMQRRHEQEVADLRSGASSSSPSTRLSSSPII